MKKLLLTTALTLTSIYLSAQAVIENPRFSATTASYVKIKKIELRDTTTKIDFEVVYTPNWWISVSSDETYIQNSKGGEKLYVKRAEGIKLNEQHWTPESGVNAYTLYFPPLDKNVEKIDFLEESWKIFDIDIRNDGDTHASIIPADIRGNWFKVDGSNEWGYGIYPDKVICDNHIWKNVLVTGKGKNYRLVLNNGASQKEIFIKVKKDKVFIGDSPENQRPFSRTRTHIPDYAIENDADFELPVFKADTAVYKGYIAGYHPKMGTTGMVYVNDILTQEQDGHLIEIAPDGSFESKIPMIYPQPVFIRMLRVSERVFLEPGTETFHYIDFSEYTVPYSDFKNNRIRKALFMGATARVNSDLQAMDSIDFFDYQKAGDLVLDMTAGEYKAYCLEIMDREKDALNRFLEANQVCKKALRIKNTQIRDRAFQNILYIEFLRESAYRQKNQIPRDQRDIPLDPVSVEPGYFDFINPDDLNNPMSLISGEFDGLINRICYAEDVNPKFNYAQVALKDSLVQKGISITAEEERVLNELIACEDRNEMYEMAANDSVWASLTQKHADLMASIYEKVYEQVRFINLEKYFGLNTGFATDIMYGQLQCGKMRGMQKPFTNETKLEIKDRITTPFISEYIIQQSDIMEKEIAAKLEANKSKTGYVINETPKTEGDKLFEAIIGKYKGKVVFVDFWATWCGPCRRGMEQMKPLKEELKDKDIEFVYITDQSSPIDTWNMMVPDIKGEHYRVSNDEWNHFASRFNISGIPHYMLVNKEGVVVNDKVYFASSNQELKKLIDEHLEN